MACNDAILILNSSYYRQQPGMPVIVVRKRMRLLSVWWCPCVFVVIPPPNTEALLHSIQGMPHLWCSTWNVTAPFHLKQDSQFLHHIHTLLPPPSSSLWHIHQFHLFPTVPVFDSLILTEWGNFAVWLFYGCYDSFSCVSCMLDAHPAQQTARSMWVSQMWRFALPTRLHNPFSTKSLAHCSTACRRKDKHIGHIKYPPQWTTEHDWPVFAYAYHQYFLYLYYLYINYTHRACCYFVACLLFRFH